MTGPYDDMLNLPHPTSRRHSRMSRSDRAAQFAPFAALSGHGTAIAETARLTERRIELDEDVKAALDFKQQITYRGKGIQVRLKNGQIMKGGQQP